MIRQAVLADVPALVALGCRFLAASRYATAFREDRAHMTLLAEQLIVNDTGVILVAQDEAITGMIGLQVFVHPWSGERMAGELMFYSETPGQGLRLLRAAERWAQQQGVAALQMVQPSNEARVGSLYERLGYALVEYGWQRAMES